QRQGDAGGEAALGRLEPPVAVAFVGEDVARHHHLPAADSLAGRSAIGVILGPAHAHLLEVAVAVARLRDRQDGARAVLLGDPDPGQAVAALLDDDAADVAEQRGFIAGALQRAARLAEPAQRPPHALELDLGLA